MIYFIQDTVSGYIKIGKTRETQLKARIKSLQTATPNVLVCVGVIMNDNQEKKYHDKFINCHYRGEWFSPFTYLLDFIKSLPHNDYIGCRGDSKSKEILDRGILSVCDIEEKHKVWKREQEVIKRVKEFQTESVMLHTYGEYKKLWLKYKDLSISERSFAASRMVI